jgi:hypothetical protein
VAPVVLGCPELLTLGSKGLETVTALPLNPTNTSLFVVSPEVPPRENAGGA